VGKTYFKDNFDSTTARFFTRAFMRLAAEHGLSPVILGVDLQKEGFGYPWKVPVQGHGAAKYSANTEKSYPTTLKSDKKSDYNKKVLPCEDRDSYSSTYERCYTNSVLATKLAYLFQSHRRLIDGIREAVKKAGLDTTFRTRVLQAILEEGQNDFERFNYLMTVKSKDAPNFNSHKLEDLYRLSPAMKYFFEVVPRLAPQAYKDQGLFPKYEQAVKTKGTEAAYKFPWYMDVKDAKGVMVPGLFTRDLQLLDKIYIDPNLGQSNSTSDPLDPASQTLTAEKTGKPETTVREDQLDQTKLAKTKTALTPARKAVVGTTVVAGLVFVGWLLFRK